MAQALAGLRVLDLSRILTGPYCTMMLADLGAEILKVEPPGGDDTRQWGPPFVHGESTYFLSVNRNKKSMTLNLKRPAGQQILLELVRHADVLVENFRPGTMEKFDLGYNRLRDVNRGLVYCAISGFGQTGPYRDKPGYDLVAQAMGGMMSTTGYPGGLPAKAGLPVADIGSGMFAAFGVLAALRHRDATGEGQMVDTSLWETMLAWHTYMATSYFAAGKLPEPMGTAHPNIVPYQAVQVQDGYVVIAVGNDQLWQKFCNVTDLALIACDPRFATNKDRVQNRNECIRLIEERFAAHPMAYWVKVLEGAGVPIGPIYNLAQIWDDPQVLARGATVDVVHRTAGPLRLPALPIKFSATPARVSAPPPLLGEHTEEILRGLGYSDVDIANLRADSVI